MRPDSDAARIDDAIRSLLDAHDPATCDITAFRGARFDHGLAWVHFPAGRGGLGLSPAWNDEVELRLRQAGAAQPDPTMFFIPLVAATVLVHGTARQVQRVLRPMYTGDERWCQLFSEPGSGSDLASVGCRAVLDGDEWIVNGQKVWSTLAHHADWGMLIARSDPSAPKHRGITYFVVDMHSPGVDVRPLRQINGEAEFNEVFLTDVRIPDAWRIGDIDDGWRVAMTTLMSERAAISGADDLVPGDTGIDDALHIWSELAVDRRRPSDRQQLVRLRCESQVLRLTNQRAAERLDARDPGPEGAIGKLAAAELNKGAYALCVNVLGADGQVGLDYRFRRTDASVGTPREPRQMFLRVRAHSIEGGTSEIMRNIVADQILGLPPEPRLDKSVPWFDVPRN